jgi:hypothetical protein
MFCLTGVNIMAKLTLPLTEADTVLFLAVKNAAGFGHLSNLAALRSILIGLKAVKSVAAPTKEDTTRSREEIWIAITPALNSPQINEYWEERKYALFSHMSPREAVEGESLSSKEKRLHKGERFYQDYIAWQEGDNTLCEVPFDPAADPKFLCNAS